MKSLPALQMPVMLQYLNGTDNVVYNLQQLILSGLLKQGEQLPTEKNLAKTLHVRALDISSALFKLHVYGVLTTLKGERYVSALSIKLKEHVFLFLLRGRPCVLRVNDQPLINNPIAPSTAYGTAHPGTGRVKSLMAE